MQEFGAEDGVVELGQLHLQFVSAVGTATSQGIACVTRCGELSKEAWDICRDVGAPHNGSGLDGQQSSQQVLGLLDVLVERCAELKLSTAALNEPEGEDARINL